MAHINICTKCQTNMFWNTFLIYTIFDKERNQSSAFIAPALKFIAILYMMDNNKIDVCFGISIRSALEET